jgi:two-component system phosphate regulon sensor histidine kinase PhoR
MGEAVKEIKEDLSQKNELTFLVGSAVSKEALNFNLSLDSVQDAALYFLDEYLQGKLLQHGIKTKYRFSIYDNDSINYLQSKTVFEGAKMLKYPIGLEGYLPEVSGGKLTLELQFENVNRYFLSQLNGLTIPSIIFLLIIIIVILWVYRSFYLQKNLITSTNEFINNLTHELKTPVFSIGVATKILEEKDHKDERELVSLIRKQVNRLKGQIEKVLELGAIEGKRGFIKRSRVDLHPILQGLALDFDQVATLENFQFESEIKGREYWAMADAYHLENAVSGLLENAKKYSKANKHIKLLTYKEGRRLIIEVSDNGIGIETQNQQKIFEKYYRVTDGDLHNVKGYGLGLNYVKRIVHLHKGNIEVKSVVNEGSTFIVKIPLIKNDGK